MSNKALRILSNERKSSNNNISTRRKTKVTESSDRNESNVDLLKKYYNKANESYK